VTKPITQNTLFYGDNLPILREYIPDESIDLIYLDPPFNSNRSYNVLFKNEGGKESEAQIEALDDTWHWGEAAERTYHALVTDAPDHVSRMVGALHDFIGPNQMMAYLVMMSIRLIELRRILKDTGNLYLHWILLPAIISKSSWIPYSDLIKCVMRSYGDALVHMDQGNPLDQSMTYYSSILKRIITSSTQ